MILIFVESRREAGDAVSFIFKPKRKFSWRAGQYLFYTIPNNNPDNRGVTRYFTISSAPSEEHITITTRIFEKPSTFKNSLMKLRTGDEIEASGPDGDFIIENQKRNFVFIAGGIGITPFRSILLDLAHKNLKPNMQLLYANHDENIVFKEELELITKRNSNLKINYFISSTRIDKKTFSTIPYSLDAIRYYISGPTNFVRAIRDIVKSQSISKENIKTDFFSGYGTS